MHDCFLSYSSSERARALSVAAELHRLGQTVWMDDGTGQDSSAGTDDETRRLPGIPVGQSHWTVIQAAIDQASTILVLDSEPWRASSYCASELEYARSVGKRIAVVEPVGAPTGPLERTFVRVPEDGLADLVTALQPGAPIAAAHARLLAEATGAGADRSRWSLFGPTREATRDAEVVATSDLAVHGLVANEALAAYSQGLLVAARRRRRTLRVAVAGGLAGLVALTAVGVVALGVTREQRTQAAAAADRAESLSLAQEALHAPTSIRALSLAQTAVARNSNSSTRGALASIEAEVGYRQHMTVPAALFSAAAVSDDGKAVLAAGPDTLTVADLRTAESRQVPFPEPMTRSTLVLSADGRSAYAVSSRSHLLCIDVSSAEVSVAPVEDVTAVDVASDGSVWWVAEHSSVHRATTCPAAESDPVFTAPDGMTAFDVLHEQRRIVGISAANVVTTFGWSETGEATDAEPLAAVALADVPPLDGRETGGPSDRSPSHVMHCGDTVHVAGGVARGLPSSTHVAFDLDGRPVSGRSTSTSMRGLGCGPGDDAWAVPSLSSSAAALPEGSGRYPVGVVDSRDNRAQTLVAESVGQRRTAVVHQDGRIDVLDGDHAPWGRQAGDTALVVPVREGSFVVSAGGAVSWEDEDGSTLVAELGGRPAPGAVGGVDRAYMPVDDRIVEVTAEGVARTFDAPGGVTRLTLSPSGDELVAETVQGWRAFPLTSGGAARVVRPPTLSPGDLISSLQVNGDRSLVTTQYGRLLLSDEEGEVVASADVGVAGELVAAFRADHGVVAIGQDGVLRSFSPDLRPERTTLFGAGGLYLRQSADGSTLLVSLTDFSVWAVDSASLEVRRQVGHRSTDVRLVLPAPDGSFADRLLPGDTELGRPALIERIPIG